jgi:hypothetical protein
VSTPGPSSRHWVRCPRAKTNRELSYDAGQAATVVLRGNFPEVRVELAVPGT